MAVEILFFGEIIFAVNSHIRLDLLLFLSILASFVLHRLVFNTYVLFVSVFSHPLVHHLRHFLLLPVFPILAHHSRLFWLKVFDVDFQPSILLFFAARAEFDDSRRGLLQALSSMGLVHVSLRPRPLSVVSISVSVCVLHSKAADPFI